MSSGFSPTDVSMTAILREMPICGAARSHAFGRVHGFEHVLDQLVQVGRVELGHIIGFPLQHRVAILNDGVHHGCQMHLLEIFHLIQITFKVAARFPERIAAKFFQERLRDAR